MRHRKPSPAKLLVDAYGMQWTQCLRTAQIEPSILKRRIDHHLGRELSHVAQSNPADRIPALAEDLGARVGRIEADQWAQPYVHEHCRVQDDVGHTALDQPRFDRSLGVQKRKVIGERAAD